MSLLRSVYAHKVQTMSESGQLALDMISLRHNLTTENNKYLFVVILPHYFLHYLYITPSTIRHHTDLHSTRKLAGDR